ncbi:MAG TPA: 16S rRNA (cytidine(1402)-2'-O)-methyltransferase [Acidimicrobiales bacterium]|nr:16S rRNA (cytidine(1402)-2'-O)-methyltransferase [Acidimicrobiales bacterium]
MTPGRLVVVATPIGNLGDLSPRAAATLAAADVVACEDTRHSRKLFTAMGLRTPTLIAVHKDNEVARSREILELLADGKTVAVVTDAGTPAVSDPGRHVVEAAAAAGVTVESIPGPSAVTTALAASGFTGDRFVFEGFLPRTGTDRRARLDAIARETRTVVLYEAPTRVAKTLNDLTEVCGMERAVVVGRELTKLHEEYFRGTLAAAALRFAEKPRGEFVLVLEGAVAATTEITDDEIVAALDEALAAGATARGAADEVSQLLGAPRNRVYKLAVRR